MPHFHFDLRTDDVVIVDKLGLTFANLEEARKEAMASLGDLARDVSRLDRQPGLITIEVRDAERPLMTIGMTFHTSLN